MIEALLAGLAATTPLEAASVLLGLVYSVLAVKRNRWCWVAGALSSSILIYLAWLGKLPMQACLQAYYVTMSVYGWWAWSREHGEAARAVSIFPLRLHVFAAVFILIASTLSARFLASQTQAAWPFLDSLVTWGSLLATWLTTQVKLENWVYWIIFDAIAIFLFVSQGLFFVALLFAAYLVIACIGFVSWFRTWRALAQPT